MFISVMHSSSYKHRALQCVYELNKPTDLFPILSFRRVERLYERRGVADEQRVAGRPGQHADHGQPDVRQVLRRVSAVADRQHVRKRAKQRPRVLIYPIRLLHETKWRLFKCKQSTKTSITTIVL